MEEKLDKFLAYLEEIGVVISGETAFKCDDGIVLFSPNEGGGVDIAIIRNVIELNYNLGITDADVNLFNTEVGIMQELEDLRMENNKPVFYMLVGLPASGKSSESDRLGDVIVRSSDYLRDKLCGDINDMKNNGAVFTVLQSLVRADLYHSKDVVYDATNLKASYRVEFLDTLRLLNCKKVCVFVDTPFEVCVKRNEERERTVPKEAMDRMKRFLEPPTFAEGWDEIRVVKNWDEKENSDGGDR